MKLMLSSDTMEVNTCSSVYDFKCVSLIFTESQKPQQNETICGLHKQKQSKKSKLIQNWMFCHG